jgi:hypothetical protein
MVEVGSDVWVRLTTDQVWEKGRITALVSVQTKETRRISVYIPSFNHINNTIYPFPNYPFIALRRRCTPTGRATL